MRIYYVFFAIAIIVSILMITYTVSKVMCKNKKNKKTTNQTFENEYSIDWRVYVTDVGGNCLSGADIILKNESDSFIIGRSENCIIKLRDPKIGKNHEARNCLYLLRSWFIYWKCLQSGEDCQ